jgi:aminoglycoside phosphotransferase (APT) family kinase protein
MAEVAIEALRAALEQCIGETEGGPAHVEGLRMLAGGASQEAWSLDLTVEEGPTRGTHELVLRRDMGGALSSAVLPRAQEFAALQAAHAAGIPVPRPYWFIPAGQTGAPGRAAFLMERIAGETIGRRIVQNPALAEARALLPAQLGEALAAIHGIDHVAPSLDFLQPTTEGKSVALVAIERMEADLDAVDEPHPALELGLRWLRRHDPGQGELVLVHGDFRVGNFIVGPEGLRAILDWENVHLGDPHEDLAWLGVRAWRFGQDWLSAGGIGEREPFYEAYTRVSGRRVHPARVFYWEVAGNIRWSIGALGQARRHLRGLEPSIELASLGRIAAEMELETLRLIEEAND